MTRGWDQTPEEKAMALDAEASRTSKEQGSKLKQLIEFYSDDNFVSGAKLSIPYRDTRLALEQLAEWQRWTQGHVWIKSEEYAELCALRRAHETGARRAYHANGTYWSGVPTVDLPCDFCARPITDHDPRTHACPPETFAKRRISCERCVQADGCAEGECRFQSKTGEQP